jgi:hypothetical protein
MNLRQPAPLLLLALLLTTGGVLSAQDDRFEAGPSDVGHMAEPPSAPDPAPVEAPSFPEPSDTPVASPSNPPEEPAAESPSGRYAVPVDGPVEPHRQPPSRGGHGGPNPPPPPGGGDDDGYDPQEQPIEASTSNVYDEEPFWSIGGGRSWFSRQFKSGGRDGAGALDLDVSPGRTRVYLDGEYVGIADRYDGWPAYLWLDEGPHELVLYKAGYKTLARQVTIRPGEVIVLDDFLVPGPSIPPEEFAPGR